MLTKFETKSARVKGESHLHDQIEIMALALGLLSYD